MNDQVKNEKETERKKGCIKMTYDKNVKEERKERWNEWKNHSVI